MSSGNLMSVCLPGSPAAIRVNHRNRNLMHLVVVLLWHHLSLISLAHIDDLKIFMSSSKFDVLAINETEPDSYISDSEINLTVFDVARRGPYREQEM